MLRIARWAVLPAFCCWAAAGAAEPPAKGRPIRALYFRIGTDGVSPSEVDVAEGTYLIRVQNGVWTDAVEVQLDSESTARLAMKAMPQRTAKTQFVVELRPGKHVLQFPGRSKWKAVIRVEADKGEKK